MLRLLLLLSCIIDLYGRTCPPSCETPKELRGCRAYTIPAKCNQDVRDISASEAHCGCLWQTYIQTIEPEAKIIFTKEGNQCYTWATKVCSYLVKTETSIHGRGILPQTKPREVHPKNALDDLLRRLERLESIQPRGTYTGLAKHRRRSGVGMISKELEKVLEKEKEDLRNAQQGVKSKLQKFDENFVGKPKEKKEDIRNAQQGVKSKQQNFDENFVGKPKESKSATWIEVVPMKKLSTDAAGPLEVQTIKTSTDRKISHVKQHRIDVDMPDDKFKLGVFMIILLLNILFVVVLIFCRRSGATKGRAETKPAGDLDASNYSPYSPAGRSHQENREQSQFRSFFDRVKCTMNSNEKKKRLSSPFLQMEQLHRNDFSLDGNDFSKIRTSSPYVDAGMYRSPKRTSHGLYENIEEESDFLDRTYEEPLPPPPGYSEAREYYRKKYSLRSDSGTEDGSSPTKYFPRDPDANHKSVSFTLQDRIDGSTNTGSEERLEERLDERTRDSIQN